MQDRRAGERRSMDARVVKVNGLCKIDGLKRDGTTLELYLSGAHACHRGSLRSELTEFLPTFFREKNASCYFSSVPTTLGGEAAPSNRFKGMNFLVQVAFFAGARTFDGRTSHRTMPLFKDHIPIPYFEESISCIIN